MMRVMIIDNANTVEQHPYIIICTNKTIIEARLTSAMSSIMGTTFTMSKRHLLKLSEKSACMLQSQILRKNKSSCLHCSCRASKESMRSTRQVNGKHWSAKNTTVCYNTHFISTYQSKTQTHHSKSIP